MPIRRMAFPPEMILPLSQHLGAPSVPIVREDQEVVRGEPIARPGGFVSVPMHAPATGIISRIGLAPAANGAMTPAIYLQLYPGATQEILYGAHVDVDTLAPKDVITAVQDTGVVGLGGAAFPTHVKMAVPEGKRAEVIIANGCECEPYLTTDHRVMVERPEEVYEGLRVVLRAMGAERASVGVELNKPDAIAALEKALPKNLPVTVEPVETKYPQGAEKMLVRSLLGREVPSGGLPIEVGAAVFNVATLAQIGELLPTQRGLIERVVTVTGPGVRHPGNYMMPLGTPLRYVLDHAGLEGDHHEIIFGGPMMGNAVGCLDTPITKGVTGILVFPKHAISDGRKVYPCIKCGECLAACPLHLNPSKLGILARNRAYEQMAEDYHLFDCFECGCCTFVCPSSIPLVQQFRVAKGILRQRQAAK